MRRFSPFRSGAFRFALMMAAIFAIGATALLILVEHAVSQYATEVANDNIAAEVAVLRDESRTAGMTETIRAVVRRENAVREHQLRYLVVDKDGNYLAGSLPAAVARLGWHNVALTNRDPRTDDGAETISLTALGARLDNGAMVVVASDRSDLDELRWALGTSSALFGVLITALALLGGFAVGRMFLRRLDGVNRSVERIMHGSLTERLPTIGMSPEFDELSANLNRMLAQIEALMEAMRQVSTDIAHDLRTPLTRLRQRLEAVKESVCGSPVEQQVEGALGQIDDILGVFRALLRISSLEAGSGRQRIAQVDLTSLVLAIVDAYRPVAEDAAHVLSGSIEPNIFGRADPEMLAQAITNLIENAIIHTPAATRISVELAPKADGVALIVADDGPGVPASERKRILDRFYRLDNSRGTPGVGLGLALVSAVTSIHGGRLTITDNHPGLRTELFLPNATAG